MEDDASQLQDDGPFVKIARKHWLNATKPVTRVTASVLKNELWSSLEKDKFAVASIAQLEQLQTLEKYLWPGYTEEAADIHVLLIVLVVNAKRRQNLPSWSLFTNRPLEFTSFFRRILNLSIDTSLATNVRVQLLQTIIGAFQSLDSDLLRKECAPLVSVAIWHNLHSEQKRAHLLEEHPQFKKAWKASTKRFEAADDSTKGRMRFDRSWLYTLVLEFFGMINTPEKHSQEELVYCERFLEFLSDLQSQFPTRRYVNTLLQDLNTLVVIKQSHLYTETTDQLFRDLYSLLRHYTFFPLDDQTGRQYSGSEAQEQHEIKLASLQRTALKHLKEKLQLLVLSNYSALEQKDQLETLLTSLSDEDLVAFISHLSYRTVYPDFTNVAVDRKFFIEVLLSITHPPSSFEDSVRGTSIIPTERSLNDESLLRADTYDGSQPLALPKLNLQYLSTADFLWRSFVLFRSESYYGIRKDLEETIKRLQPRKDGNTNQTRFAGSSHMALPIQKPAVLETTSARVGEFYPSEVRAELILDVSRLSDRVRRDWDELRPGDVVFLLSVQATDRQPRANGESPAQEAPYKVLRTAEVIQVQDQNSRPLRGRDHDNDEQQTNGFTRRPKQRRILVKLDAASYHRDTEALSKGKPNVYDSMNTIVRRRSRENNFKALLEAIRQLILTDAPLPIWLQDVFLGLGDPSSASYKHLTDALQSLDFRDTFLNWQHLLDSLPDTSVKAAKGADALDPPYVLETETVELLPPKASKKRRIEEVDATARDIVKVSTYKPPNMGPYASDIPKTNQIRFTPAQVEAIKSGTQPGLTVIVGPPGTGKTDVATQIINNIYHNFPGERTLLVAHSNQALNQMFQKIVALDVDERHLLRLGHGEGDLQLDKDKSYSRYGRVESLLEVCARLLREVDRLAATLNAPGAHGSSCETADYFYTVYVKPLWTAYLAKFQSDDTTPQQLMEEFPFQTFFYNAPQPLFPSSANKETVLDVANGCQRHIDKMFSELEDIRPFEVLRHARDKANYLLVKEAKIIAMTSTHAAIHRQEIVDLGFHYDNVVMEEAAQITEVENFIPLALQKPTEDGTPLKRVVMCGDHLQNSPIIQNLPLRQFSQLDQSLFQRFVRLGVPTVVLDRQGRARPSIAELYKWRYPSLENLPFVETDQLYQTANAGLRYDYQFIDVGEYKGKGESCPAPHFIQNLGEAEYIVALYMYMRLLGYPASKISIITTYAGQRALIRDVLQHRCAKNKLFGMPRIVATVDKYQGEQNDYVLLSLVRTRTVGYLRDLRRLTVALSRAKLGFYVFGRRDVFEASAELAPAFGHFFQRSDKLSLVVNEMFPTARPINAQEVEGVSEMEGVEHLGQYVYEMTQAKVKNLREGREKLAAEEPTPMMVDDEEYEEADGADESPDDMDEDDEDDEEAEQ